MGPIMVGRYAPLAAAALVLLWHTLQYNFVTDDAYITFVYARNLAEHGALVFNPSDLGNPVEGYTNFLWAVLLAGGMVVGISPEISALVLGAAFATGTLVIAFRLAERLSPESEIAGLAPGLLSVCAGFACWASGGLETQMFTFFVIASVYLLLVAETRPRAFRWLGVTLALAALTRPEGLLIAAIIGAYQLVVMLAVRRRWMPRRDELVALALLIGIWLPWFAWRWWYYGYPFPNTYYVKAAGAVGSGYEAAMRKNGLHYAWTWVVQTRVLWLAPLVAIGAFAHPRRSAALRLGVLSVVLAGVYIVYAIRVGGDFMGLHRFVMPATVLVIILAAIGAARLAAIISARAPARGRAIAIAIGAVVLALFAFSQLRLTRAAIDPRNLASDRGIDTPAYLDLYARDRARIGDHMRPCFRPGDFSIFGGVGAKPYRARAEGIDVFGLVSRRIAHEVARTRPRAGHNKWGPDGLLADYDPDFVFSCYSLHREATKPRWNCSPGFWKRRGYEAVTLHIPGLEERGEYYTFLVKKERRFECAGRVDPGRGQ